MKRTHIIRIAYAAAVLAVLGLAIGGHGPAPAAASPGTAPSAAGALPNSQARFTIRRLEGDVTSDCQVRIDDLQEVANHYLAARGSLLYSPLYDISLPQPNGVVDVADLQFVFGRFGSTCANPIPPQPPTTLTTAPASGDITLTKSPTTANIWICTPGVGACGSSVPNQIDATDWQNGIIVDEIMTINAPVPGVNEYAFDFLYDSSVFQPPTIADQGVLDTAGATTTCSVNQVALGHARFDCKATGPSVTWSGPMTVAKITLLLQSSVSDIVLPAKENGITTDIFDTQATAGQPGPSPTPTGVATATGSPTSTPTSAPTATGSPTSTPTAVPTATDTPTSTATAGPTSTPGTPGPTSTTAAATSTPTGAATATGSPTPTLTAVPTATDTPTTTAAASPTSTPGTPSPTSTPGTPGPTSTPGEGGGPVPATATSTPDATPSAPAATSTPQPCSYDRDYWRGHPDQWPTDHLHIGRDDYNSDELLALLNADPSSDPSVALAQELITVKLNAAAGRPQPPANVVALGDSQLSSAGDRVPQHVSSGDYVGQGMLWVAAALAHYEQGDDCGPSSTRPLAQSPTPVNTVLSSTRRNGPSGLPFTGEENSLRHDPEGWIIAAMAIAIVSLLIVIVRQTIRNNEKRD